MPTKGSFDRDDILNRISLEDLADELVGPSKGHGSGRRWPSPTPGHEQTGKTPPMSIFTTRYGEQRFTCFATGASGTAIDLVMTSRSMGFRDSLEWLAGRAGVAEVAMKDLKPAPPKVRRAPTPEPSREPDPALGEWVGKCAEVLQSPAGVAARGWLSDRGIPVELQRVNQLGFDPGPAVIQRPSGVPRTPSAVIFPVRNEEGEVVYAQSRDLEPGADPKYMNPGGHIAPNPNLSFHDIASDRVVVTEGVPDALVANSLGYSAVAVLGTGNAMRDDFGERIAKFAKGRPVVLGLDADVATERVDRVCAALEQTGAKLAVLDLETGDITDRWKQDPALLNDELEKASAAAEMMM